MNIKPILCLSLLALFLTGCTPETVSDSLPETPPPAVSTDPAYDPVDGWPTAQEYIDELVSQCIAEFSTPEMDDYQKVKAASDYLIQHGEHTPPIALDLWRFRSVGGETPDFTATRSLSLLNFGYGTCEDYAAALVMLLRGMGLEAEYVPGMTYHTEGFLVDHAWAQVKLDGVWYHIDPDLEDEITRNGTVRYRYFLKGDETMSASHRWGQNMIDSGLLTPEQNAEVAAEYLMETCPQDYPAVVPVTQIEQIPLGDREEIEAGLRRELEEYEKTFGPLPALEVNYLPPVFDPYTGFGNDRASDWDAEAFVQSVNDSVLIR